MSNKDFIFQNPDKMSKEKILTIVASNDYQAISEALIAMVFYEEDFNFCLRIVTQCFESDNFAVRGTAALCMGHLARIHRKMPSQVAIDIISRALKDDSQYVRGQAENALGDIRLFIPELATTIEMHLI